MFDFLYYNYKFGYLDYEDVYESVAYGFITKEEFKKITGKEYK